MGGAIFGFIGANWADFIMNNHLFTSKCRNFAGLLFTTLFCVAIGLLPWFDNFAHLGGLICGLCLGLSLLVRKTKVVDDDGRAVSTDTLPSTSTDYCGCRCITR